MKSKEHYLPILLSPELQLALTDMASKNRTSILYAAQSSLIKSLRSDGFLTKEVYEKLSARFSKKLVCEAEPEPLTKMELDAKQKLDEKERYFSMVLSQWGLHPRSEWRLKQVQQAKDYPDLKPAQMILDLGRQERLF